MHWKYEQKFDGGDEIVEPPQKLYPHGFGGAPHSDGVACTALVAFTGGAGVDTAASDGDRVDGDGVAASVICGEAMRTVGGTLADRAETDGAVAVDEAAAVDGK
jgi:hypothetical protein